MAEKENIQEVLLEKFKSEGTELTVFLLNGFQMKGKIVNFDDNVVLLDIQGKENLIYKHAISTFADAQDEENKENE
ncbi:RNA chaperone Hfq [Mammaliicoccus vitulinus]|uniref:RNA-binding protein Hfq n=1 Tax=Mammaliicoccus vitulinus TaxID=71237 RepID=A0A2T4PRW8_9STAP|nr:RNA chaperone Hfq [Mammaliicoccus vitulinus]PTI28991.1 RNA chaperone Hfq [Mammaliicoccus vitulinus]